MRKNSEDQVLILGCNKSKDGVKTAHGIGTQRFTLLKLELDGDVELKAQDKIFIRNSDEVKKIVRALSYDDLSNSEKSEVEKAVHSIVITNKDKYLNFYNSQTKDASKLHLLEGISQKSSLKFLAKKEELGDFKSFEDIDRRISFIDDSENLIAKRVLYELIEQQHVQKGRPVHLFVDVKMSRRKQEQKLDKFEDDDSFFLEKLKKQGLIESSGKKLKF